MQTPEQRYASNKRWRKKHPVLHMLQRARQNAKRRKVPYSITIKPSIPKRCPILGIPLKQATGHFNGNSPSLDKIVPRKGYVDGNIQVISARANVMKNDATPTELRKFARWIRSVYGD